LVSLKLIKKMKKYSVKNFSTRKMLLYSVICFILTISLIILTNKYIGEKIYPGIVFIILIIISIFWIKNNCWTFYEIIIDKNNISINKKKFQLSQIIKYSINGTEHFYGIKIFFPSENVFFNVSKKNSLDYLSFKNDFLEIVKSQNNDNYDKIKEYDWYRTKSAKIYGYIIVTILILWTFVMFLYPEKLKISNLSLFFIVLGGLFPILIKIFRNK